MRNYGPIDDFTVVELYPDVQVNRDNVEYYRGLAERRLLINRCGDCHTWIYPHRPICCECWSWNVKAEEVSGFGSVFMWTTLMQQRDPQSPPEPMPVAAVDFAEQKGLRYLSRIVNCAPEHIYHDMPVRLTWIEISSKSSPLGGGGASIASAGGGVSGSEAPSVSSFGAGTSPSGGGLVLEWPAFEPLPGGRG